MKLGALVSGVLGFEVLEDLISENDVIFVMTDKKSLKIIEFCKTKNIALFVGNPRKGKGIQFAKGLDIEVLISINYLFLIDEDIINLPQKLAFNIHGSLLPKYRGRTPHIWAIINNEDKTGITAHVIDKGCDTGEIIEQKVVAISKHDTGASVLGKFRKHYIPLVRSILYKISNNEISLKPQEEDKATYYGKRTPLDGKINWEWQKERIRNWVRAQTYPYPGSFTNYQKKKVIVDEIEFCDTGYNYDMKNGQIISGEPLIIKCPNGALKIKKIRNTEQIDFQKGEMLF